MDSEEPINTVLTSTLTCVLTVVLILLCLVTLVLGWLWVVLCRFLARSGRVLLFIEQFQGEMSARRATVFADIFFGAEFFKRVLETLLSIERL